MAGDTNVPSLTSKRIKHGCINLIFEKPYILYGLQTKCDVLTKNCCVKKLHTCTTHQKIDCIVNFQSAFDYAIYRLVLIRTP